MSRLMLAAALALPTTALATPLPPDVAAAKAQVVTISEANLDKWGNTAVQAQLEPHVETLADWFAANRPANEVELTQQSWRSVWYEDESIVDIPIPLLEIDRTRTYQVVRDGYYVNLSETVLDLWLFELRFTSFLKGEYTVGNPASPANAGERAVNVVDLEFTDSAFRLRKLPRRRSLTDFTEAWDDGNVSSIPVPGPAGVTGELYNLFVDEDVRVAFGQNNTGDGRGDGLYVLVADDDARR